MQFQNIRPDYRKAIEKTLELAKKYTEKQDDLMIASFGCGSAQDTKDFVDAIGGVKKVALVDINAGFLEIAKQQGINTKELEIHCTDASIVELKKEYDLVFSFFIYHHIKDEQKNLYVKNLKKSLKARSVVLLTEIYIPTKEMSLEYYKKVYDESPNNQKSPEYKEFLEETARSNDFEFKVSKEYADNQFSENGFSLIEEIKIYPTDHTFENDLGTFVQVYKLD